MGSGTAMWSCRTRFSAPPELALKPFPALHSALTQDIPSGTAAAAV